MYDAIVIGARCAGSSTAMLLARKGHRVLLLDRAAFPSDIPLSAYERRRNDATMMDYRMNLHLASFQPAPEDLLRVRAAIRGNAGVSKQFYMAVEGMIPREDFIAASTTA